MRSVLRKLNKPVSGESIPLNTLGDIEREQKLERKTRRRHSVAFKAKVAQDKLVSGNTLAEFIRRPEVHPNKIMEWKRQLNERAANVFGGIGNPAESPVNL